MSETHPDITSAVLARSMSEEPTVRESSPPARETARLPRRQIVFQLLLQIRERLERAPSDKITRTLERKLESLRYVVDCWNAMPPSPEQVSAMLEVLVGLDEAAAR